VIRPFTPARRRGVEILDDPRVRPDTRARSMADVVRSNTLLGGRRAVLREIDAALQSLGRAGLVLDVGTGLGDIPAAAAAHAHRRGVALTCVGLDGAESLLRTAGGRQAAAMNVCGNALLLPFADRSFDIVLCSQLLHHFEESDGRRLIAELDRVARRRVIVADLRRSWVAAIGFWIASIALRFDAVTRHDGVVSVLRGFTTPELRALVERAVGVSPATRRALGYRLTVSWAPVGRSGA